MVSTTVDPTPIRLLTSQGVDFVTARRIVEQATFEWQHGNTVVSPMRVAMQYVARLDRSTTDGVSPES